MSKGIIYFKEMNIKTGDTDRFLEELEELCKKHSVDDDYYFSHETESEDENEENE